MQNKKWKQQQKQKQKKPTVKAIKAIASKTHNNNNNYIYTHPATALLASLFAATDSVITGEATTAQSGQENSRAVGATS